MQIEIKTVKIWNNGAPLPHTHTTTPAGPQDTGVVVVLGPSGAGRVLPRSGGGAFKATTEAPECRLRRSPTARSQLGSRPTDARGSRSSS